MTVTTARTERPNRSALTATATTTTAPTTSTRDLAVLVVDGGLTEVRADPVLGSWSTTLHAPAVRIVEPDLVHDVHKDLLIPAVSIHAYSPPLSRITYYDLQDGHLTPVREVATNEPEVAS